MNARDDVERRLLELLGPRVREYFPANGHENCAVWVGQMFEIVRFAVDSGDTQAISIACDLIEGDPMLPFGNLVKSNLARALKKQIGKVIKSERDQVLGTTRKLLMQEFAPRELEDYCKLVKKFPRQEILAAFADIEPRNGKSAVLLKYMRGDA